MEYSINIEVFQGPFELLYHLIEKREINIYDIPISEVTDQYIEYLEKMMHYNMNVASEFILMASTLIEIKSQMLLPQKESLPDPREELVNKILEYKQFKDLAEKLKKYEEQSSYYYAKPKEEIDLDESIKVEQLLISEINILELREIFLSLIKNRELKVINEDSLKVYREHYSVKDCVEELIGKLKTNSKISLFNTLKEKKILHKEYVITLYLAILELSSKQNIKIYQNDTYSDIILINVGA